MPDPVAAAAPGTASKMPGRNHHSAPKFDGKPASLSPFLDEVEQLGEVSGLSPKQQIDWAIRYAPNEERELWQMQEAVGTDDWEQFKKELFELYPSSSGERKYSIANLQTLIDRHAKINIEDADDFGTYRRAFLTIATYLKKKSRLTDREISIYFLHGLDPSFRNKIQVQLKAENPTHHTDDPYTLAEISTAALFILSCNHTEFSHKEETTTSIKKETFDVSQGYGNLNINTLIEEVAKRIGTLEKQQVTGAPNLPKLRNHQCIFCSDPNHYLSNCPKCSEYIQKGFCQKNIDGQIVLPNGNRINPREMPGRNLKERIDNWQASNSTPQVSTNFVATADLKAEYVWPASKQGNDTLQMSSREEEELQVLENLVATTQKKIDNARKKYGPARQDKEGMTTRSKAQNTQQDKATTPHTPEKPQRPEPQFRYVTPIEDPALIAKVSKQSLDASITISTRELLSIAPDVRRHIKDQLITKRVGTATTGALLETVEDEEGIPVTVANITSEGLIVAKHTEELRVIDVSVCGVQMVATIDDGSQIVSIRQDMWERIGLPIRSDKIMLMESANKTKDETMGLLQDLKISIGGYHFYLQVQVVKSAPYEMLLGRPFFTLTQATHKHFEDGESRLTLYDPNTNNKITFPTRAREREQTKPGFQ